MPSKDVIAPSVRGGGEQDMLTLMAIAIRELAYDYGLAAPINRNAEAAQHGLTVVRGQIHHLQAVQGTLSTSLFSSTFLANRR